MQADEQLQELQSHSSCQQHLQVLTDSAELSKLSLSKLESLSHHIKKDMERVEQVCYVVSVRYSLCVPECDPDKKGFLDKEKHLRTYLALE